jgi:Tfp pilus assembly protein PilN
VLTGAAVGALVVVLGGAYVVKAAEVKSARDKAKEAEAHAADLQTQVTALAPYEQAEAQIKAMEAAAQSALATDVDLPVFMDRITAQMPNDVGLTSFAFNVAPTAAAAPGAGAAPATLGSLTISATGLSHDSTAHWITNMRQLGILSNLWVSSSTKAGAGAGPVTFPSSANVTTEAKSNSSELYKATQL